MRERALLRKLIGAAQDIATAGFNPEGRSAEELVDEAERLIMTVSESGPKSGGPLAMAPLLTGALERIEELYNTGGDITGLTTGFIDLDKKTSGLQPSDLVIVAGRPSMGKTSFAMNLVENAAANTEKPILVFSMEMPAEQLVVRMMSSLGKIDQSRLRTGKLQQEDWPKLSAAMAKLKDTSIFIDDTPALAPTEIRARSRRLSREHGDLAMIMVDYLQLMRVAGAADGRTAEISLAAQGGLRHVLTKRSTFFFAVQPCSRSMTCGKSTTGPATPAGVTGIVAGTPQAAGDTPKADG